MTKAERIYRATKFECKKHIKVWGYEEVGFNRMHTEELIHACTKKEIKKLIERDYKDVIIDLELNVISEEEAKMEVKSIKMVELTLANQYIA